jgi:hypothetical protein
MGYLDLVDLLLGEELGIHEGRWFRNALGCCARALTGSSRSASTRTSADQALLRSTTVTVMRTLPASSRAPA